MPLLSCAFEVGNKLGIGYLEKIYENAMVHEMRKRGLKVAQQVQLAVHYDGVVMGEFFADALVEECVLLEFKATKGIEEAHVAQCLNSLKTSGFSFALIINCGATRVQTKRVVRNF